MSYFLTVLYDDCHPDTYEGMKLSLPDREETVIFNSGGGPTSDYWAAGRYVYRKEGDVVRGMIMCSSSLDHFVMDGGELDDSPDTTIPDDTLRKIDEYVTKKFEEEGYEEQGFHLRGQDHQPSG